MAVSKYLSETLWIGSRAYLVEVKNFKDSKQKFMIITQPEVPENQQDPVIVSQYHMTGFLETMQRVSEAMLPNAPVIGTTKSSIRKRKTSKPTATAAATKPPPKQPSPKPKKANPPEFFNSGKRWTASDDQLLIQKFQSGETIQALTKVFKRRTKSIEVRLHKLGILP